MPLFDYCDVIWTPSTAKQTCMIERIHSKFMHKLPSSFSSKFQFTLTERRRFHTAIQIFKSLHRISPPYLHDIFQFLKDVTGHLSRKVNRLFVPTVFINYGKRTFFSTKELFYGTTLSPLLLGLPLCCHFVIIILILNSSVILSMYP